MKKLLALLLVCTMMFSVIPVFVSADDTSDTILSLGKTITPGLSLATNGTKYFSTSTTNVNISVLTDGKLTWGNYAADAGIWTSSEAIDYLTIDLGEAKHVNSVTVIEAYSFVKDYRVAVSLDGVNYITVADDAFAYSAHTDTAKRPFHNHIRFPTQQARYVRFYYDSLQTYAVANNKKPVFFEILVRNTQPRNLAKLETTTPLASCSLDSYAPKAMDLNSGYTATKIIVPTDGTTDDVFGPVMKDGKYEIAISMNTNHYVNCIKIYQKWARIRNYDIYYSDQNTTALIANNLPNIEWTYLCSGNLEGDASLLNKYKYSRTAFNVIELPRVQAKHVKIVFTDTYGDTIPYLFNVELYDKLETDVFETDDLFTQSIEQYSSFDFSDPQLISDEEFFGEWNGNEWTSGPYFNYADYPELHLVEEAAKVGDYDSCKEEILSYYRTKFDGFTYTPESSYNTQGYKLWAELIFDNMMCKPANLMPTAKVELTETPKWVYADVAANVKKLLTKTNKCLAYNLVTTKKDGYALEFSSKETAELDNLGNYTKPYIEAVINGVSRVYYPSDDTTLRGGDYYESNFGSSDKLLVEESYTTINTEMPIDSYSKRAYLKFDFSDLVADDVVSSATLYLYGKMCESDNPIRPDETKDSKYVYILNNWSDVLWNESILTWSSSTLDACFSYDGEMGPLNNVPTVASGQHSAAMMGQNSFNIPLSRLYYYTEEEVYAYHCIRLILNAILRLHGDYTATTQCFFQTGERMAGLPQILFCIIGSEYMTPDAFTMILKDMHMEMDFLVEKWCAPGLEYVEGNNIGALNAKTLVTVGMHFNELLKFSAPATGLRDENLPGSMLGGWLAVGKYRMFYMLEETIYSDGSSGEIPLGYVGTNINPFFVPITTAEKIGYPLDGLFPSDKLNLMVKNALYMLDMTNPIGGTWQQGDDSSYKSLAWCSAFRQLLKFIENPNLLWGYSRVVNYNNGDYTSDIEGEAPAQTSIAYDTNAKAVLRSSWERNAVAAQVNADGARVSHGHNDDLHLNIMAYGNYLLADPDRYNYYYSPYNNWQISTRAHNTVEINNTSQRGRAVDQGVVEEPFDEVLYGANKPGILGTLHPENREFNNLYDFIRTETYGYMDNYNAGADFEVFRDVLFLKPGYFIVTDYIKPDNAEINNYKQGWHFLPNADIEIDQQTKNIRTRFYGEANLIIAPVDSNNKINAEIKQGVYSSSANISNLEFADYAVLEKNQEGITTYNTIIYPVRPGEDKDITAEELGLDVGPDTANAFRAEIYDPGTNTTEKISYYTLFDKTQKAERIFGNYSTDGELAFVEESSDKPVSVIIRGGTGIKNSIDNKYIVKSNSEISDLGIKWEDNKLILSTSKTDGADRVDVNGLIIYSEEEIENVVLNDEEVGFLQAAATVIVGEDMNFTVDEGQSLTFKVTAGNPGTDKLTYSAGELPEGAVFDCQTRTFAWIPDYSQAGTHTVQFTASDGEFSDVMNVNIIVNNVNLAPAFEAMESLTVDERQGLVFTVIAVDPDGDEVTYSAGELPEGAVFDCRMHTFTWTPDYSQAGTHTVQFIASDGELTDTMEVEIIVEDVPARQQVFNLIEYIEGLGLEDSVVKVLVMKLEKAIEYLDEENPIFAKNTMGAFETQVTIWRGNKIPETAADYMLEAAEQIISDIDVSVNHAPVFEVVGRKVVNEGQNLTFKVTATDRDGDELTYLAYNLPEGAVFDSQTCTFSWTPDNNQAGNYEVRFTVSDGEFTRTMNVYITVINTSAIDQISALILNIEGIGMDEHVEKVLIMELEKAVDFLNEGKPILAEIKVRVFEIHVKIWRGKKIPDAIADNMLHASVQITGDIRRALY